MSKRRFSLLNRIPTLPISTTAELEDVNNAVNTTNKREGVIRRNTTTGKIVVAVGKLVGDVWQDADGATLHTPV